MTNLKDETTLKWTEKMEISQRILPILSISHCPTYLDLVACFPILSHLSSAVVSLIIAILL